MSLQSAIDVALREAEKQRRQLGWARKEKERVAFMHGVFVAEQIVSQLQTLQSLSRVQKELSH